MTVAPRAWRLPAALLAILLLPAVLPVLPVGAEGHAEAPEPLFVRIAPVTALAYDRWTGELWAAGSAAGVLRTSPDGGSERLYSLPDGLPSHGVEAILPTESHVLFGTSGGVGALDRRTGEVATISAVEGGGRFEGRTLVLHAEGAQVYVGTAEAGLFRLDAMGGPLVPVPNPENGSRFAHPILGVLADGDRLWVAANQYGLVEWNRATGETRVHSTPLQLFTDDVYVGVLARTEEHLWVGTRGEGARRYDVSTRTWQAFANPDNLAAFHVYDIEVLGDEVWFGTETGIARYKYRGDSWQHWSTLTGFPGHRSAAIAVGEGHVWADGVVGLARFDRLEDTWRLEGVLGHDRSPPFTSMSRCVVDGDRILFGTRGAGATHFDPATGTWDHSYPVGTQGVEGLPDILVEDLAQSDTERWFATHAGLTRESLETGDWSYYRTDARTPRPGLRIADVVTDIDVEGETVALASRDRGMAFLDREADRLRMVNASDGLSDDYAVAVEVDGENVWVGTRSGLDRVHLPTREVTRVYPDEGADPDGVIVVERTDAGLLVGSVRGGLFVVDPETLVRARVPGVAEPVRYLLAQEDALWIATNAGMVLELPWSALPTPGGGTAAGAAGARWTDGFLSTRPQLEIFCLLPYEDLLYVATNWGVFRLDLVERAWLRQEGLPAMLATGRTPATLNLEAPTPGTRLPAGSDVGVAGTVSGPAGLRVEARLGLLPWRPAALEGEGPLRYSLRLEGDPAFEGPVPVSVRALAGSEVLAERSVPVTFTTAAGSPSEPDPEGPDYFDAQHVPPLVVFAGDAVTYTMRLAPAPDAADVTLRFLGEETTPIPLAPQGDGRYEAQLPGFTEPGTHRYTITASAAAGTIELPKPGGPFGQSYPLTVRTHQGFVSLYVAGDGVTVRGEPGERVPVEVQVQNTGSRSSPGRVMPEGDAADWVIDLVENVTLAEGATVPVGLTLAIPPDAAPETHELTLLVVPLVESDAALRVPVRVVIGGNSEEDGARGSPAPGLLGLLAAGGLAVLVLGRRRS